MAHRFHNTPNDPVAWGRVFQQLWSEAPQADGPPMAILTPAWNTQPQWFCEAAVSVLDQTCRNWEWLVVDDGSTDRSYHPYADQLAAVCPQFRFHKTDRNYGISGATNTALNLTSADFICFLDHDDLLHREAIGACLRAFADKPAADAVYTDLNKVDEQGLMDEPFYKPDWSPTYFRGVMYVGHLLCVRRDLAVQVGGFDSGFDGVQDFEFFLRYSEQARRIVHLPNVLYHWRRAEGSLATATGAKDGISELHRRAVEAQLERQQVAARAMPGPRPHRVDVAPRPVNQSPSVSIIIPTRDKPEILEMCLNSIRERTTHSNLQIICADNDTVDESALQLMRGAGITRVSCPGEFNFSKICNRAVQQAATGEYILLLNNDVEVVTPEWLEEMLFHVQQPGVGAVGAMLLYPNQSIQHAGIALGFRGTADHLLRGAGPEDDGYAGSLAVAREVTAVTGACLLVHSSHYGLNEHYQVLYQDVDFCLRLQQKGLRNVWTPRARLIHHESYSRSTDYNRLDRALFIDCWDEQILRDPYFNVNFSRETVDYQLAPNADLGR
jgi:O-antigen biosynthesis protein